MSFIEKVNAKGRTDRGTLQPEGYRKPLVGQVEGGEVVQINGDVHGGIDMGDTTETTEETPQEGAEAESEGNS